METKEDLLFEMIKMIGNILEKRDIHKIREEKIVISQQIPMKYLR
jgi:hypothetical protein